MKSDYDRLYPNKLNLGWCTCNISKKERFMHKILQNPSNRLLYADYLRGFMILLVVLDHSMHAYSQHFANFWFIPDVERNMFFDIWHMHNDAIMMPFLFLLSGIFIYPSLTKRGVFSFAKERFIKLVIPFFAGVIFIVPFNKYPKYLLNHDTDIGFFDYLMNHFFFNEISASGFWFLYFLVVLTTIAMILYKLIPSLMEWNAKFVSWMLENPVLGFITFCLISALILGCADLKWGAHWWMGWGKMFYIRSARFILKIFYFFVGVGIGHAAYHKNLDFLEKLGARWKQWVAISVVIGALYMTYSLTYFFDGAYSIDLLIHFYHGGEWADVWPIFIESAPMVLLRTTLLGTFMASLTLMYFSVFYRFLNKENTTWLSLAACSYGIYIFHEPLVVWSHYFFYGSDLSPYIKFVIAAGVSLSLSWVLVKNVFLKLPGFRRVL